MWNKLCDRWNAVITEKRFSWIFLGLVSVALLMDQKSTLTLVVCTAGMLLIFMEALALRNQRRRKREAATLSARGADGGSPRPR